MDHEHENAPSLPPRPAGYPDPDDDRWTAQAPLLFNTLPLGVMVLDDQCTVLAANASAATVLGVSREQLIGTRCGSSEWNAVSEDGSPLPAASFPAARALATGSAVAGVVVGVQAAGSLRWIRMHAVPLQQIPQAEPVRLYVTMEDITGQRSFAEEHRLMQDRLEQDVQQRTQELTSVRDEFTARMGRQKSDEGTLRSREELFRRFADSAADLFYFYRLQPERRFEFVSAAAAEVTGYTPEEHYANPDLGFQLVHAEDRHLLQELLADQADFSRPLVLRWVRKDGCIVWIEQRNVPVRDPSGALIAIQGIARDITDRIRTEERLRESERFLQTIIDSEPECVKLLARDGTLLMMNQAGLAMIDADSIDQVRGKSVYGMVLPQYRPDFSRLTEEAFQGKAGLLAFEAEGLKGRRIWLETKAVPLRDEQNGIMAALGITRDITAQKQSEEMLRNIAMRVSAKTGEDYFRAVTKFIVRELGTDMAFIGELLHDGRTIRTIALYVDGSYGENFEYDIAGTPCENVIGRSFCFHPAGMRSLFPHDALLARLGIESYAGIPLSDSAGSPSGGLVTLGRAPLRQEDRERIIMVLRIFAGRAAAELERAQAEAALKMSEQRYRQLLESITSYIYTVTVKKGRAVSTSHGSACLAVTGYRAEEYAAHPFLWYQMVHDADKQAVLAQAALVLAGGHPQPLEHRLYHKNGSLVWVRNTIVPRFDSQGTLVAYDGVIEDITERKRTEFFIKSILETVDEGFVIIDRNLNVVNANRAYLVQIGMDLGQIVGKKCYEVGHRISRPCYEEGEDCVVRSAIESKSARTMIHTHYDAAGNPVFVETKAFPLRGDSGEVVAAIEIVNDITERKRLEDQLRQSQKMEAVGMLAGGIAHDFNNILTAIVGYGNLLKMKTPADDPRIAYAEQILDSAARAANLTQSLLAFSRKQVINPRPLDLNDTVRRFEKLLKRVIGEDIELRTSPGPGEMTIMADSSQIEQVLMNLATNARDAMPNGGTLEITTSRASIDEEFRKVHGFGMPGPYAVITLSDTGTGIEEAALPHLFEPFYTTKQTGKGSGLGLAIVYGIMKQNKSYILVESEPGRGTTFRLYFPLIAATAPPSPAESREADHGGPETILLAEDDSALRQLASTMLTEFGYTVIQAADGEDAVAKFRANASSIALAILDVVMPRKGGKEVYDEIVRINPEVRVLYISGYNAEILQSKGIAEGATNFILKPVSPTDLLRAIRAALDRPAVQRPGPASGA
jgi:two-component system cell cycle sensor histidine kinase/response regulator CckA